MRYSTHIHLESGVLHEHITRLRRKQGAVTGEASRAELVQWVRTGRDARVKARVRDVKVEVVDAMPPYLRTKATGIPTDNLLELPRF